MSVDEPIPGMLEFPLYQTFRIHDLDSFTGFSPTDMANFRQHWSRAQIASLTEALAWAVEHPDADYAGVLPNLLFSNPQLVRYLRVLHQQFAQATEEWYGESA